MSSLIQQLANGAALGCIYGLIALGYSFIYNAIGLVNLAQGSFVMVGSFIYGVTLINVMKLPHVVAFFVLVVAMAIFGIICEMIFYRPLKDAHIRTILVGLVALELLVGNLAMIIWGPYPRGTSGPFGHRLLMIGDISISYQNIFIISITLLLLVVQSVFFKKTTLGKVMRAVAQDRDTARLMGIESDLIISATFAYSSILGGIAGMLVSPLFAIETGLAQLGFKGFGACVIGAFSNIIGAFTGGLILGVAEIMGASYVSSVYKDSIVYLLIIAFLLFRPQGLFGKKKEHGGL
ncbi:MAG: branched-chain amino acid ABC transporter permease [Firmicutes bacterium]|nr:branched-chain amino acid ABC transporter permease [Bacillota bacterium]